MKKITKKELMRKLDLLKPINKQERNELVCVLVGHSRISTTSWGYRYCARCGEQVGDNLGSIDPGAESSVIVGHNCKTCRKNYKKCTWQDKLYCPDPFKKEKKNE